jgi:hypothetical protein
VKREVPFALDAPVVMVTVDPVAVPELPSKVIIPEGGKAWNVGFTPTPLAVRTKPDVAVEKSALLLVPVIVTILCYSYVTH